MSMSKKIRPTQTKLSSQALSSEKGKIGILNDKKRNNHYPKAFRLTREDLQCLTKITKNVNQESKKYISETKVIQALIHIGLEIPAPRILKAIRELW